MPSPNRENTCLLPSLLAACRKGQGQMRRQKLRHVMAGTTAISQRCFDVKLNPLLCAFVLFLTNMQ